MRIHVQAFINKHGQNTGRVEHQQTGMVHTRHKSGQVNRKSSANVIQGAKQREISQAHNNSPGRGKQSPNDKRERERERERDPRQGVNFRAGRDQTS